MSAGGYWGDPTLPPTLVSAPGVQAYEVVTVNADGTVDLRNRSSRATRGRVPALVAGWTPSEGDRVLAVDLGGNQQRPAIITVQTSKLPFG